MIYAAGIRTVVNGIRYPVKKVSQFQSAKPLDIIATLKRIK